MTHFSNATQRNATQPVRPRAQCSVQPPGRTFRRYARLPASRYASRSAHYTNRALASFGTGEYSLKVTEIVKVHVTVRIHVRPPAARFGFQTRTTKAGALTEVEEIEELHRRVRIEVSARSDREFSVADVGPLRRVFEMPRLGAPDNERELIRKRPLGNAGVGHLAIDVPDVQVLSEQLKPVGMGRLGINLDPDNRLN